MSYQEKRSIVSIITGILIIVAYGIYVYGKQQSVGIAADDMKFWSGTILMFIGIGVVASILIQIVFHILLSISMAVQESIKKGKCDDLEIERAIETEMTTDEMDKLIELKSLRVGFVVAGTGFILAMLSQVMDYPPAFMFNILFISFIGGSLIESFIQIHYYRKGVRNG